VLTRLVVLAARVRALFERRRLDDNVRRGMPHDEARRAALVRFRGPQPLGQQPRDRRGAPAVDITIQE
jgi:hypothetical protein